MKTALLWSLVAVNALLLVMFVGRGQENAAMAQQQRQLPPGSYLTISGSIVGGSGADVVYVLDTRNQLLTAVQQVKGSVNAMAPIDLTRIFHH